MKKITGNRSLVKPIRQKGDSVLVEYVESGATKRKFIPSSQLIDGLVSDEVLQQGIPYGYPWEELELTFDSQKFANEMHQIDIWTVEDALRNPAKLWSALRATLAGNLTNILETASSEKKRSKHHG